MGEKNRVKLSIGGCELVVVSEDSEAYMMETGARVDDVMRKCMLSGAGMSTTMAAIFAALEFCDGASKEKAAADHLRSQIKAYFDDASHAREEAASLRQELAAVKRKTDGSRRESETLKAKAEAQAKENAALKERAEALERENAALKAKAQAQEKEMDELLQSEEAVETELKALKAQNALRALEEQRKQNENAPR